jgi:hypothetical protein
MYDIWFKNPVAIESNRGIHIHNIVTSDFPVRMAFMARIEQGLPF